MVYGHEAELGSFSVKEMQGVRGPMGLPIERDISFSPKPLSQCEDPTHMHENPLRERMGLGSEQPHEQDQGEQPAQQQKRGPKQKI
jgi:hypothetical protein